jgi:hypothetical protein
MKACRYSIRSRSRYWVPARMVLVMHLIRNIVDVFQSFCHKVSWAVNVVMQGVLEDWDSRAPPSVPNRTNYLRRPAHGLSAQRPTTTVATPKTQSPISHPAARLFYTYRRSTGIHMAIVGPWPVTPFHIPDPVLADVAVLKG